ncbi:hypothetical protein [Acinetobacter sp.]|jgi:hypothetical protein|uniref:hypothetical protein n=1 Tax=Acinetobacter sp. TaxID=472 RepID=UPI002826F32F|nr:hypothetical protein [Acinetobacter sp.]MDR0235511.1 hypothetical protein [Acinetobacter sp.]
MKYLEFKFNQIGGGEIVIFKIIPCVFLFEIVEKQQYAGWIISLHKIGFKKSLNLHLNAKKQKKLDNFPEER